MKKTMLISIILIFMSTVLVFGNTNYQILADVVSFKITIDGIEKKTTSQVVVIDGVTYLPVREVAEMLGLGIEWDGEKEEIKISTTKEKVKETENNEEKLYPFKENNLYGYMDKEGNVIVEPIYFEGESFSDGMALVKSKEWNNGYPYGYINTKGELAIPFQYGGGESFYNGVAVADITSDVYFPKSSIYINKEGKQITRKFEATVNFSDGLGLVLKSGYRHRGDDEEIAMRRWSYVNPKGEYATEKEFEDAGSFNEGYASVKTNGKWGKMDKDFNIVLECQYEGIGVYSEGLIPVEKDEKWGVVDIKGNQIVDFKYDSVYPFSDGLANVCIGDKFGYINKEGEVVIPIEFKYPSDFKHGLITKAVNGKFVCINTKGEYILEPEWDEFLEVEDEDLIRVGDFRYDDSTYYIDTKGNFIGPKK